MAQRRLNKNLVVGLVVGLMAVISLGIIIGLAMLQPDGGGETYVREAVNAYRVGDLERAAKNYGLAFRRSRDPNWLVAQGQVLKDHGDPFGALKCWDQAVVENENMIPAHEARIRMRLDLVGVATPQSGPMLSAALRSVSEALLRVKADHPLAHFGVGIALTGLKQEDPNNEDRGIAEIEKAYALSPADKEFAKNLANVYEITRYNRLKENKQKEADEYRKKAEDVYLGMIKADPDSARSYLTYADFLMRRLRGEMSAAASDKRKLEAAKKEVALKQIEENLQGAEKRHPDLQERGELGMTWAEYWDLTGEPNKVIQALEKTIQDTPGHLDAYLLLANRRQQKGDTEGALKVLEAGLARDVDRGGFMKGLNKQKRFNMLCLACETKIEQSRTEQDAEKRKKHLEQAQEFYNRAAAEVSGENWRSQQVLGELREAQGQLREAQAAYEAADKTLRWEQPGHLRYKVQVRLRLAQIYTNQNNTGLALQMLNPVVEYTRHLGALLMRANINLKIGKLQEAVDDAKPILADVKELGEDNPIIREATLVAMAAYQQQGKLDRVKELQQKSKKSDTAEDKLRDALIYQAEKDDAKAAEAYRAALKEDPANRGIVQRAVQFFYTTNQKEEARKVLQAALAKRPDDTGLKRLGLYLEENFEKLDPNERNKRELAVLTEIGDPLSREAALHEFYLQRGDLPNAMTHLDAARKLKPDDPALLEREFTLAIQQKDWARANRCWEQAVKIDADNAGGRFYKGRIPLLQAENEKQEAAQLELKDMSKSREHQNKANELYAEAARIFREGIGIYDKSSMAHYWLGAAEEGLGHLVEARDAYSTAIQLNPTNAGAHRALAKMGKTYQNVTDADLHLKEAIRLAGKDAQGLPFDPWLRAQVETEMEQKDPDKAIAQREELRKKEPKNIYNLMPLAVLYEFQKKDNAKAEKCVAEALQAEPKNAALLWDASRFYSRNKQWDKAEKLLRDYVKQAEGDEKVRAQVMVARHYVALAGALRNEKASPEEWLKAQLAADQAYAVAIQLKAPPQVYNEAATFCFYTGRAGPGIKWLRDALEINKDKTYESLLRRRIIRVLLSSRPVPIEASGEISEYLKRFPDDAVGLLFRGELFAAQGKVDQAIEEHTAYVDQIGREGRGPGRESRLAEGYRLRGQLYLRRAKETYADRDNLVRLAINDLSRAKGAESGGAQSIEARILLAQAYELSGRPDEAVQELKAILASEPKAANAADALVQLYTRQKRWADQEALIRLQINVAGSDNWYWQYVLGRQLEQRGQASAAVAPLRKACEILKYGGSPNDGSLQVLTLLLRVLGKSNNNQELIDIVTTKVPKENRTSEIQAFYAGALAKSGKQAEALQEFRKAVGDARSFNEHSSTAGYMAECLGLKQAIALVEQDYAKKTDKTELTPLLLSTLYALDNRKPQALPLAAEAVAAAKDPSRKAICLASQGIVLYDLGKKEEAAAAYTEALRLREDLTVLNNLAYVLADDLKRPKEALPYAERAVRYARDASILDTMGWCLFLTGKAQDAIGMLGEAINQDPAAVDPRLHLAQVYAKEGRKTEAEGVARMAWKIVNDSTDEASRARVSKLMKDLGVQP
jgi:tetratricopeptide (TPR) repeat protein